MESEQDGGDTFTSTPFPSEYEAFGYHQDGQYNMLMTDGYGLSHGMVVDSPLPDTAFDLENFPALNSEAGMDTAENHVQNNLEMTATKTLETHELDPDAITPGQQVHGTSEGLENSRDLDLMDNTVRQAPENLGGASSGKVLPSASSEHAATEPSQPAGLGLSHLDGPGQAGSQGATGVDGTKNKAVGQTIWPPVWPMLTRWRQVPGKMWLKGWSWSRFQQGAGLTKGLTWRRQW